MIRIKKRPYKFCFTGNAVHYQLYSEEAQYDQSVTFEVKILFSHNHTAVPTDEVITLSLVPVAGYADLDIKDILHAQLTYGVPLITGTETDSTPVETQSGVAYIQYRQITPVDPDPSWTDTEKDQLLRVVKGGVPAMKFQGNNFWKNYFESLPITRFFTWQVSGRLAALYERMYLCWWNTTTVGSGGIKAKARVVFTDGTEVVTTAPVAVLQYQVAYVPTGATQWDFVNTAAAAGKKIYYWEIVLEDQTDPLAPVPLTEVFKYYADNRNVYNPTVLHYRGSLGGLDSVLLRGIVETNLGHSYQELEKAVPFDYYGTTEIKSGRSITAGKELVTWRGDAGHLYREEQDRLRDALVNRNGYQYSGGKWYPILLVNQNFRLRGSRDKRFAFPLEWQLATPPDLYYSPDSVDLGNGTADSNVCECTISNWTWTRTFSAGDTICNITNNFQMACTGGDSQQIQFRVIGNYDWQDYNLASGPLVIMLAAGTGDKVIEIRVICPNGVPGVATQATISTNVGVTNNSQVSNTGSHSGFMSLFRNGDQIFSAYIPGGGTPVAFNLADVTDATIILYLGGAAVTFAQLTTNGGADVYSGPINPNVYAKFDHVDVVGGVQIVIS